MRESEREDNHTAIYTLYHCASDTVYGGCNMHVNVLGKGTMKGIIRSEKGRCCLRQSSESEKLISDGEREREGGREGFGLLECIGE